MRFSAPPGFEIYVKSFDCNEFQFCSQVRAIVDHHYVKLGTRILYIHFFSAVEAKLSNYSWKVVAAHIRSN